MRAIKETGYDDGYVGQEFTPRNGAEWAASLEKAYRCAMYSKPLDERNTQIGRRTAVC